MSDNISVTELVEAIAGQADIEDSTFARSNGRVLIEMSDKRNFDGYIEGVYGTWVRLYDTTPDFGRDTEKVSFVNLALATHIVADVKGYEAELKKRG